MLGPARGAVVGLLLCLVAVAFGIAPAAGADRDGDGLRDGFETRYGATSPDAWDSDRDGVIDSAEDGDHDRLSNLGEQRFGTNPRKWDSDRDGRPDGREDRDGDGRSNAKEQDRRSLPTGLRPSLRRAPEDYWQLKDLCRSLTGSAALKRCHIGDPDSDTTVVLVGNSHAFSWLPSFKRVVEQEGWHLIALTKGACVPWLGVDNSAQYEVDGGKTCRRWRRDVLAWLAERTDATDLVVMTSSDRYALVDGKGRRIPKRRWPQLWRAGLQRTLERMPPGTNALVLGDVPRLYNDPVRCLRRHRDNISACTAPRKALAQRPIERSLRTAADARGASFRTLYGKICSYDPCPVIQGDILMWRDNSHLSATFSERLAPALRSVLRGALR